jgi:PAS domain S-box-containing protein
LLLVAGNIKVINFTAHKFEVLMKKTDRKEKVDQEIKKNLLQLRQLESIINRSPAIVVIWRFAEGWPVEFVSENIFQFGYTKDDFLKGRISWSGITHPDDLVRVENEIAEYNQKDIYEFNQEYRLITKSGDTRWVEDRTIAILDQSGKVSHYQGIILDVTERKIAQLALEESENTYRSIFKNTGTAMAIAGEDRKPLLVNDEVEKLTGYSKEELVDKKLKWSSLTAPHDRERLKNYHKLRLTSPDLAPRNYEYQIVTKSGELRDVFMTSELIPGTKKSLVSMMDVTSRKTAQEALRKSAARFRELFRNSLDIICIFDSKGIFIYVSPSMKHITGYAEAELIGKCCFDFIHPDDLNAAINAFAGVVKSENKGIATELRFHSAAGSWVYLEALGNNCLANPAINGIVINARDITERKRMESQLLNSQKLEAIGTLAGGIAHDFNNILMGIQGYISLMMLKVDTIHPDFDKLISIQSLVQSGADLTGKLLGFARGGQYEIKPTDLNELIYKTVNIFGRTKKEISIHQKYEKKLWTVEVDRVQIEQVLLNLYVNAWQAMQSKGGDIYLETDNIAINAADSLSLNIKPGDYARIMITDTGDGMDKDTCLRVFEPFFTTKEKGHGVGLGLASAYGIIKKHDGIIDVFSEVGDGTCFSIYLPASQKEVLKETFAPKTIFKGTETILLVDDEESIIDVCHEILIALGYNIYIAHNGKEAISIYSTFYKKINLVLLDMIMPGMSGAETYDALKAINPAVKVVLSTGYSLSDQAQGIMERGCQAFIQKPFRIDDLSQKIREVLDKKQ